jgi:hypothetical protein
VRYPLFLLMFVHQGEHEREKADPSQPRVCQKIGSALTNPERTLHEIKIPSTAATPGWYSGAWFELNRRGPTMLPTALPALHREIARDFFVCPGQDSVLLWWIMTRQTYHQCSLRSTRR